MPWIIYTIPFFGALTGAISLSFVIYQLFHSRKYRKSLIQACLNLAQEQLDLNNSIKEKLETMDMQVETEALLDKHLQELILSFKKQIPMGGMFLTESLTTRMKTQAKEEIIKILPDLKQKMLKKFLDQMQLKEFIEEKMMGLNLQFFEIWKIDEFRQMIQQCMLWATVAGFMVGVMYAIFASIAFI